MGFAFKYDVNVGWLEEKTKIGDPMNIFVVTDLTDELILETDMEMIFNSLRFCVGKCGLRWELV